jgi:hypothetical protein
MEFGVADLDGFSRGEVKDGEFQAKRGACQHFAITGSKLNQGQLPASWSGRVLNRGLEWGR